MQKDAYFVQRAERRVKELSKTYKFTAYDHGRMIGYIAVLETENEDLKKFLKDKREGK